MNTPIPVHLITGLLGSGKTTCLQHLIQQKPQNENWAILINEFGEVDIDASQLLASSKQTADQNQTLDKNSNEASSLQILAVSGGCICCTAQLGLVTTLNQILSQAKKPIDRIWVEPTGLGHPAKIIDSLQKTPFAKPLQLQKITCIITPMQLTQDRWKKSAVMRDLVNLADTIVLNKIDLATNSQRDEANEVLANCYPPKNEVITTQFSAITLNSLLQARPKKPFTLLSPITEQSQHQQHTSHIQEEYNSEIAGTQKCFISQTESGELLSMGWIWSPELQFNRVKLKALFEEIAPYLIRAKALLKTGNEWQLLNWSNQNLQFEDIAWRQDNRLECLFKPSDSNENSVKLSPQELEKQIKNTINNLQ
ncbi:GTP-binding protein [Thiomicrorhabdus hydrogeniphila]